MVLAALALVAVPIGCEKSEGSSTKGGDEHAVAVSVAPTRFKTVQRSIDVTGSLNADEDATISAKVPGRIAQIFKDVGDRAGFSEPLAQIDSTDYELSRTQKQADFQQALSQLGLNEFPSGDFDPTRVPSVVRAKLQADNANAKLNRGKKLYEQKPPLISEQDFADMQTVYEVAKSDYDVALLNARSLLAAARTKQAELAQAEQLFKDTTIRAPESAVGSAPVASIATNQNSHRFAVAQRMVSVGEYVKEGTPLFRVVADDPIKYRAAVPERFAGSVSAGQTVQLSVESSTAAFEGKVSRVSPQIDPTSRTFQVEALIANESGSLKPGAFARGGVITHADDNVLFVPSNAIVTFAGVNKLFTVHDGKALEMRVQTGMVDGDWTEITSGVKEPQLLQQVITTGAAKLAQGTVVTVGAPTSQP
jgi:multidrug efflux pump subunit AcrA (membrane-fusion protein)